MTKRTQFEEYEDRFKRRKTGHSILGKRRQEFQYGRPTKRVYDKYPFANVEQPDIPARYSVKREPKKIKPGNLRSGEKNEFYRYITEGAYRSHGNYVGPGWSAGKYQPSVKESNVPPVDEFDATAKTHDIETANAVTPEDLIKADFKFAKANIGKGFHRSRDGALVGAQGAIRSVRRKLGFPEQPFSKKQQSTNMARLRYGHGQPEEHVALPARFANAAESRRNPATAESGAGTSADVEPASNLMAASGRGQVRGSETKLTSFDSPYYGLQGAQTVWHTYQDHFEVVTPASTSSVRVVLRLNSVEDLIANIATTQIGGSDATPIDGTGSRGTQIVDSSGPIRYMSTSTNQPSYVDYWKQYYRYYTVLKTEWKMTAVVSATAGEPAVAPNVYQICQAYWIYHGSTDPPNTADTRYIPYWKDVNGPQYIYPHVEHFPYPHVTFGDSYACGEHHEILDDAEAQVWTEVGASPAHAEFCSVLFGNDPNSYQPGAVGSGYSNATVRVKLEMKLLVQWKDLKQAWKYWQETPSVPLNIESNDLADANNTDGLDTT